MQCDARLGVLLILLIQLCNGLHIVKNNVQIHTFEMHLKLANYKEAVSDDAYPTSKQTDQNGIPNGWSFQTQQKADDEVRLTGIPADEDAERPSQHRTPKQLGPFWLRNQKKSLQGHQINSSDENQARRSRSYQPLFVISVQGEEYYLVSKSQVRLQPSVSGVRGEVRHDDEVDLTRIPTEEGADHPLQPRGLQKQISRLWPWNKKKSSKTPSSQENSSDENEPRKSSRHRPEPPIVVVGGEEYYKVPKSEIRQQPPIVEVGGEEYYKVPKSEIRQEPPTVDVGGQLYHVVSKSEIRRQQARGEGYYDENPPAYTVKRRRRRSSPKAYPYPPEFDIVYDRAIQPVGSLAGGYAWKGIKHVIETPPNPFVKAIKQFLCHRLLVPAVNDLVNHYCPLPEQDGPRYYEGKGSVRLFTAKAA